MRKVFMKIIRGLSIGLVTAVLITLLILTILAGLMMQFDLNEGVLKIATLVVFVIGIFIAAFISAKITGRMGWITGALTGLFFIILVGLIGMIFGGNKPTAGIWINILIGTVTGAVAGMAGVSFSYTKR